MSFGMEHTTMVGHIATPPTALRPLLLLNEILGAITNLSPMTSHRTSCPNRHTHKCFTWIKRISLINVIGSRYVLRCNHMKHVATTNIDHPSSHTDQKHKSSNLLPLSPVATETVTDTTVPNHDEKESTEFEKNQKRYQDLISTFPHVKGWRPKAPLIEYGGPWWVQPILEGSLYAQEFFQARPNDFLICSYPKIGATWLKSLAFTIANRSRFDDSTNPLLKRNPHELIPFIEIEFPLFPHIDVLQDEGNTLFTTHMPHDCLPDSIMFVPFVTPILFDE
ncbi:unnamed protein product [Brassica napus]|uniref:Sulfotransferase n=1 Tax=Brassica napus TaxID=3708 RepID=A0A816Z029_BRANA|nr:unnamed protein product [Brassica napus]